MTSGEWAAGVEYRTSVGPVGVGNVGETVERLGIFNRSGGFCRVVVRGPDRRRATAASNMTTDARNRFEEQVLPHLDAVFRMARRLARDDSEADDLVQETFVRAFRAFPRFEMREYGVKPWLFRIVHNVFYTRRGKEQRQPTLLDDVSFDQFEAEISQPGTALEGLDNIAWDAIDEELKRAVDGLAPEYRVVLLLWSFEDMRYKEIAEVCECAVGTVMSRLYRARRLLGEALAEYAERENVRRKP